MRTSKKKTRGTPHSKSHIFQIFCFSTQHTFQNPIKFIIEMENTKKSITCGFCIAFIHWMNFKTFLLINANALSTPTA